MQSLLRTRFYWPTTITTVIVNFRANVFMCTRFVVYTRASSAENSTKRTEKTATTIYPSVRYAKNQEMRVLGCKSGPVQVRPFHKRRTVENITVHKHDVQKTAGTHSGGLPNFC